MDGAAILEHVGVGLGFSFDETLSMAIRDFPAAARRNNVLDFEG
jgi:hypothetical protein